MCLIQDKMKAKNVEWMIDWHNKEMIADNSIQIHSNKVRRPSACTAHDVNTFAASYLNTKGLNNSCLKSPASTLVDLTFQSRALRSFSLNQLRNLSL